MVDKTNWKIWMELAEDEFKYALADIQDENHTFYAQTCFHFHQAAEKYLKAFILAQGLTFRKIHNLVELTNICISKDSNFKDFIKDCATLNPFYTDTRYPVHWPMGFNSADMEMAKDASKRIRDYIKKILGK